mgnify:CR=1 FL=1
MTEGGDIKLETQTKQLRTISIAGREKKHDKIFKEIFQDKQELVQFLFIYIGIKTKTEELELYNTNFITTNHNYRNADIVYKEKNREIYYLIEQQTYVESEMARKVLDYSTGILGLPENQGKCIEIVPIVLYTGKRRWTAKRKYTECQKVKTQEEKKLEMEYILVDIKDYNIEQLIKEKTKISIAIIFEKCKNSEEVITYAKELIEKRIQIEYLGKILKYLYGNLENPKINDLIEEIINIKEEEEVKKMSTIRERLKAEYVGEYNKGVRVGIRQGISRGVSQTWIEAIKKLIQENMTNEVIKRVTGYKEEEIEKIRKETKENKKTRNLKNKI